MEYLSATAANFVGKDSADIERQRVDELRWAATRALVIFETGDYLQAAAVAAILRECFRILHFIMTEDEKRIIGVEMEKILNLGTRITIARQGKKPADVTSIVSFGREVDKMLDKFYDIRQRSGLGFSLMEKRGGRDGIRE